MSYCARCGNRLEDSDRFCQSCGAPVAAAAAAPVTPAAPPPAFPPYSPVQPPQKKGSAVKWIVIGGIAVVLVALALVLVRLIGGLANRAADDPDAGLYSAESAALWGVEIAVEDVYPDGFAIDLQGNGKCRILIGDKKYNGEWEIEDGAFHLEGRGLDCEGTIGGGVIVLEDVMDSGVSLTFLREGAALPEAEIAPTAAPSQPDEADYSFWSGDWYGWWSISARSGAYAEWDGNWWDCCATIEPLGGERVLLTMWDEDYPKENPVAQVELRLVSGDGAAGWDAVSEEGVFWNSEVGYRDYEIDRAGQPYDNSIIFTGTNTDDKGSFEYTVFLRPWGQDWSDVDEEDMPYYYDWYRAQIADGATEAPTGKLNDYLG